MKNPCKDCHKCEDAGATFFCDYGYNNPKYCEKRKRGLEVEDKSKEV